MNAADKDPRPGAARNAPPPLGPQDLIEIATRTIGHYDAKAVHFWEQTRDHDVTQNRECLLRHIESEPPFTILDLGCGGGRDLNAFRTLGHTAIGLDGSAHLCTIARRVSRCEVLQQDFLSLSLPGAGFDGVFANASLFHVPTQELPRVLGELREALKPRGVLFCSNPHGENQEGWQQNRYASLHDYERWRRLLGTAGFTELEHYYRPAGEPRHRQPWLASAWRRNGER